MASLVDSRTGWEDLGKLILRLTVAVLLGLHGVAKMKAGVGFVTGLLVQNGLPSFLAYGALVGEVVAPILLMLGILTRPAALIVVIDMLFALFLARRGDILRINPPARGGGWAIELEMLYLLAALAIFFLGAGRYSLAKRPGRWD